MRSHPPILLVQLAIDLDDLSGRLGAAREEATAHHRVCHGHRFHDVSGFHDPAISNDPDTTLFSRLGSDVESGELGDADTRDDPCRANGTRSLAYLDDVRSAFGEKLHA